MFEKKNSQFLLIQSIHISHEPIEIQPWWQKVAQFKKQKSFQNKFKLVQVKNWAHTNQLKKEH